MCVLLPSGETRNYINIRKDGLGFGTVHNLLGRFDLSGIPPAPRGIPQIEVTFDIDANGILDVEAKDESTGKSKDIRIQNHRGRLSQAEIDRMVNEAQKYKDQDEKQRQRVAAHNSLEHMVFSYKQAVSEVAEGKISSEDKETVTTKCDEVLKWLDSSTTAEKEEYEFQQQELQKVCSPIMAKLHGASPGGPTAGQSAGPQASSEGSGPTIEEMD